jgi:hypothetical protein
VALRSLSAVLGVALVFVMYELGRRLADRRVGIAAALLAAVSEFLVHYSQEARSYALLALLTALSSLCLFRLLDRWSGWSAVAHAAVITFLYTHVYGFSSSWHRSRFWPSRSFAGRRSPAEATGARAAGGGDGRAGCPTIPWLVVFAGHLRDEVEGASNAKLGWLGAPSLRDLPGALSGYAGSALSLAVVLALPLGAAVLAARRHPGSEREAVVAALGRHLLDDRRVVLLTLWLATPNLHASALPP